MEKITVNILLIDHESYRVESLQRGLRMSGHNVFTALSPGEASELLAPGSLTMDLIITDCSTPLACNLEVVRGIREPHDKVPVVMMTTSSKEDLTSHPLWPCCAGLIEKPFALDQLLDLIEGLGLMGIRNNEERGWTENR